MPTVADYGIAWFHHVAHDRLLASVNSKTITVASTVGVVAGQGVSGTGVPAGTTISAIGTNGTTFTVNNNETIGTGTQLTLSLAPSAYAPVNTDGGKSWIGGYRAGTGPSCRISSSRQRNLECRVPGDG